VSWSALGRKLAWRRGLEKGAKVSHIKSWDTTVSRDIRKISEKSGKMGTSSLTAIEVEALWASWVWVIGFGREAEVLEPEHLRWALAQELTSTVEKYVSEAAAVKEEETDYKRWWMSQEQAWPLFCAVCPLWQRNKMCNIFTAFFPYFSRNCNISFHSTLKPILPWI